MSGADKELRGPLGGLVKRRVIRDLALSGMTQSALAEKYGVSQPAIAAFKRRNAEEIAAVAAKADDEFAGILIADKANRITAYEQIYEQALVPVPKVAASGKTVQAASVDEHGNTVIETVMEIDHRAAMQALKSVAEEMGQLPTRLQVSGDMTTTTTYRIEGVSPEDLT